MLPIISIFIGLLSVTFTNQVRLTSVNESIFNQYLYRRLKNENPPSTSDPASGNARIRKQLCNDIAGSGLFETYYHMLPGDEQKLYLELKKPKHALLFRQMFSTGQNHLSRLLSRRPKYTNEFVQRTFRVNNSFVLHDFYYANEYVFVCLLKDPHSNRIQPLSVSKEYNLNERNNGQPFTAGRFVFGRRRARQYIYVRLAEESAKIYLPASPDFNIELYYLGIRSHRERAENLHQDPVCRLVLTSLENNQLSRLCTSVLTAAFAETDSKYPMQLSASTCEKKKVTFRTEDATLRAAGRTFYENMVSCMVPHDLRFIRTYYVSRAYTNNQVFLYEYNTISHRIYLKNLSINLHFVLEPTVFNFDDVE